MLKENVSFVLKIKFQSDQLLILIIFQNDYAYLFSVSNSYF